MRKKECVTEQIEPDWLSMSDIDLKDKRVIIREDLNVPIDNGKIINHERIKRALPTLKQALQAGAKVLVLSHLGRPKEGEFDERFSLALVAKALSQYLDQTVPLIKEWLRGFDISAGKIAVAENVRFNVGEKENDPKLAKRMAELCDVFVMDAFATAHRAHASTVGIANFAPVACAGPLLTEELNALTHALDYPKRPLLAIVGGAKVSTKIQLLESLLEKVNGLIVGGGMANTFLAAQGYRIGKSLYEPDWVDHAKQVLQKAKLKRVEMPLPSDVVVGKQFKPDEKAEIKQLNEITKDEMIMDVGPQSIASYHQSLKSANTIVWNGPVGVFEFKNFSNGTRAIAQAVANSSAYSIAGGGDTLAALDQFKVTDRISYVSTGGGAFLMYLEGTPLPAIEALKRK